MNEGAALAQHLSENTPSADRRERKRLQESIDRALAIREALERVVQLPEPRAPGELTVKQIAELGGMSASAINRYLETVKGKIGKEYSEARELGRSASFSPQEAQWILRQCKRQKS
ncbi:MAG: hypothetical protein ABSG38_16135 [Spirochaetia bacterium]